jgi:AcrR family transcriptional regulator
MKRNKEKPERVGGVPSHDKIMTAIAACIEKLGLEKCTMDDFAIAVGISRISLYRTYGNKTKLIDAVLAHRANRFNQKMSIKLASCSSLEEALIAYFVTTTHSAIKDKTIRYLIDSQYVFKVLYSENGSSMRTSVEVLRLPLIEKFSNPIANINKLDKREISNWILVMQASLARVAIESKCSDRDITAMVKNFILPAFTFSRFTQPNT